MVAVVSAPAFGQPIERLEDDRLVRGGGRFVDDLGTGFAHVAFVRSEEAHARISDIAVDAAVAMPGVLGVFTHADLDAPFQAPSPLLVPHKDLIGARTQPPLARDEVCYRGQTIVAVVARNRYEAEDAAAKVRVTYERLERIVDVTRAAQPDAPLAHLGAQDNIAATVEECTGDIDAALASAAHVFELRVDIERSAGMPMETRAVAARWDDLGERLTMYDTTQSPAGIKAGLARLFERDPEEIEVVAPDIGGSFGAKAMQFYPEEVLVPWIARRLRTGVKWTEDRRENFIGTNHERRQVHDVRVGVDEQGRIVGLQVRFVHDTGAFIPYGLVVPIITASTIPGPYKLGVYHYRLQAIYTNAQPTSPYRGAGRAEAAFVMERVIEHIARELGEDAIEVRRRNMIQPGDQPYVTGITGQDGGPVSYDGGDYPAGLELLLERIEERGLREQRARLRAEGRIAGLGIACYVEGSGLGPYEGAAVKVLPDGTVTVGVSLSSQGQGHETTLAQVAAEALGVPPSQVRVILGDTRRMGYGIGTIASRAAVVGGNAVLNASREVRRQACVVAAEVLEVAPGDIRVDDGHAFVASSPERRIPLGELAVLANPLRFASGGASERAAALSQRRYASGGRPLAEGRRPGLSAVEYFSPVRATYGYGMHAALLEVDPATYRVQVLSYLAMHDSGRMINPRIVEGQVAGAVVQGIAGALYERLAFDDDGRILNADFRTFFMPFATEAPSVEVLHVETPSPENPLGVKGVAETGIVPVAAVIASALEDCLGVPIDEMPLDPSRLRELAGGMASADKAPGLA
jgi:carbon-monoxide dehydrogenase large subunit